jgi:hypothetical protein
MERIVFLNTTILTCDGTFSLKTMSLDDVKLALAHAVEVPRLSAIGHESTAQVLTELLGEPIAVNRIQYCQADGDFAICFKLNGRPLEGKILSKEEIEAIGYELKVLTKV